MESGKKMKKACTRLWGRWLSRLTDLVRKFRSAQVPDTEKAPFGTEATPRMTVSSASQTTMTPELHDASFVPTEVADRLQELENEIWQEKCAKKITDEMATQIMQLRKDIQAKNNIISELKKKLAVHEHDKIEHSPENAATITNKSLNTTGGVNISHFDFFRILGVGGFGTVFLVQKRGGADDGRFYAMKMLEKARVIQNHVIQYTMTERSVLEAVGQHPFLTTLHYAFQSDSKLYLALDYVRGGDLLHFAYGRNLTENEVRFYISETILALEYLHKLGIMHRDVKPENILLDLHGHVVLSDFGVSKMFLPHEVRKTHSQCGTLHYMAPELLQRNAAGYDMSVDWWSLGIVTYRLLTGGSPFERQSESVPDDQMVCRIIMKQPCIPDHLSFDAADFISQLLVKDPRKRLGGGKDDAEELKRHPFLKEMNWSDLAQKKISAPLSPINTNELNDDNFPEEFTQEIPAHSPATLPPDCDEIFRGYSYVSPSVLCRDEPLQPTAETGPYLADDLYSQYACRIEYLEKELSEAKRIQMNSDMEKTWLELDLTAAIEKIEFLEAELSKANCVQKRCNGKKRRLQRDLRDAKKKIMALEVKVNDANCPRNRYNKEESKLETNLRTAIKRIQSLEAELIEANCAWKRYSQINRKMEIDLKAATERIESLEAEFTKANWIWKRYNREQQRMETHLGSGTETTKSLNAELTEANCAQQRCNRKKRRPKRKVRGAT
jgi:serine/threonine protein kinase